MSNNGMLKTTTVGSFPKPDYLARARTKFSRGQLSAEELKNLTLQATREVIKLQEEIGLDILVDGEMERGDMATFFAEKMAGFKISGLVRSYGNRYYRKPVVVGKIARVQPMTLEIFKFAQGLTNKPIKGMLTGPYTMCDWSFNEFYPHRRAFTLDLAAAIHEEALELERAGAKYIQIDEPALSTRPEEIDMAIEGMGIVTKGLKAKTITHICYGRFDAIYPKVLEMPIDQIDLEMANNQFALLDNLRQPRFTKEIGLGVIDVHSHLIEEKEQVKAGLAKALEVLEPAQIYVDPDCGLKTRTMEEAKAKLEVMVAAVKEVKAELSLP
jgi:5-methyltetrahydropteroyltriglutamate--homocysteine methyltransferase